MLAENITKRSALVDPENGSYDPTSELIIVGLGDKPKEIIVVDGLGKYPLGSNAYALLLQTTRQITQDCIDKYGLEVRFIFINRAGYLELTNPETDDPLAVFIRGVEFKNIPIRVIRADNIQV